MLAPGVARLSLDVVFRRFATVYIVVGTAIAVPAVSVVVEVVIVERRTRLALMRVKSIFGPGLSSLNHALKHSSLMQRSSRGPIILLLLIKGVCWGLLVRIPH